MNRQKSILSFFQKASLENKSSGERRPPDSSVRQHDRNFTAAVNPPAPAVEDVRGTDTPPEKVPRQVLPATFASSGNGFAPNLFESIMHKFVSDGDKLSHRSQSSDDSLCKSSSPLCANGKGQHQEYEGAFQPMVKNTAVSLKAKANQLKPIEINDDVVGPETPGMQPLASHAKRSRDDESKFRLLMDSGKRFRFLEDSPSLNLTKKEAEVASRFEWLDPSRIRDASGRRPNDPLYDRTTLYIPPDALKKMSASQKQYWSVKCKYMDVLL